MAKTYKFERIADNLEFQAVEGTPFHWRLTNSPLYRLVGEASKKEVKEQVEKNFRVLRPKGKTFYDNQPIEGLDD
jgi:hypothetical protein